MRLLQTRGPIMKKFVTAAAAAGLMSLAACNNSATDQAAENIEEAGDVRAEQLDEMADNATNEVVEDRLEQRADQVDEATEEKADALRAVDDTNANVANTTGM